MSTLFDKIWDRHLVLDLGGGIGLIAIDRVLLHERTGSVALESLATAGRPVAAPSRAFVTMDHVVDTFPGRTDKTIMPLETDLAWVFPWAFFGNELESLILAQNERWRHA